MLPEGSGPSGGLATSSLDVAGLFAGIGGLERGLRKAGHHTSLLCEIDPVARVILSKQFDVIVRADVRSLSKLNSRVQLLAAGFPCQDLSQAGERSGIGGRQSSLVNEIFRLLRTTRVEWVLLENVPFMLRLQRGRAMDHVVRNLEKLGYAWAYRVVDARAFGLPQRRERVILLAARNHDPRDVLFVDDAGPSPGPPAGSKAAFGFYWTEGTKGLGWAIDSIPPLKGGSAVGIPSPPAIVMPNGDVVTPDIRDAERLQGFPVNWTSSGKRLERHRWRLVGNAVSVDVAEWVGRRLRHPSPTGRLVDGSRFREGEVWPDAAWNVGEGRHAATGLSTFPERVTPRPLADFLRYPTRLLSARATAGFLKRATKGSSVNFPDGFLNTIEKHLRRMQREQ